MFARIFIPFPKVISLVVFCGLLIGLFGISLKPVQATETIRFDNLELDLVTPAISDDQNQELVLEGHDSSSFFEKSFEGWQWLFDRRSLSRPVRVSLINSEGETIKFWQVSDIVDQTIRIDLTQAISNTIGLYEVLVEDVESGQSFSQDFSWGVLAMNLDKDVYLVGETADIAMSVLDSRGLMECSASLKLEIRNSKFEILDNLTTGDQSIQVTGSCPIKSYVDEPDYQTIYQFDEVGEYDLELTAVTTEGSYTITQSIEVVEDQEIELTRRGPTRIYPPVWYPMEIEFTLEKSFSGSVIERVPSEFLVSDARVVSQELTKTETDADSGRVTASLLVGGDESKVVDVVSGTSNLEDGTSSGDDQYVVASGDWKAGVVYTLVYQFKTPFESPEFFTMGPVRFAENDKSFYIEKRAWQLAIDAEVVSLRPTADSLTTGWFTDNCSSTTNLYLEIDDDPDSPTDTNDFVCGPNSTTGQMFVTIGSLPGNFPSAGADSVQIKARHQENGNGNDTIDIYYQVYQSNRSSAITAEVGSTTITQGSWTSQTYAPSITGTNTSTSWTDATLRIRQVDNQASGPDATNRAYVSAVEVNVTYTPPTITVSGNLYEQNTTTASNVCDGTNPDIAIISTGGVKATTSCNGSTGAFTTTINQPDADDAIVIWIDGQTEDGATVIRYDGSGDSTNNILYESTAMVMSDDTNPVDIIHMNTQDNADDPDIPYTATDAGTDTLVVNSGIEFQVKLKSGVVSGSNVFVPAGTVTTNATGGDFRVDDNADAYLDTATNTIGRDVLVEGGATLNIDANTTVSGGDITTSGTSAIVTSSTGTPTVTMSGTGSIGGGTTPSITFHDLAIATGATTTIASTITVNGGDLTTTSTGILTYSGTPTVNLDGTGTLGGGSGAITFYTLDVGDATTDTTTVSSDFTVENTLTVNASQTLALGSQNVTVGATGVTNSGGITQNGTTSGTGTITILSSASGTATMSGSGTLIGGNLTIGNGSTTMSANFNTNNVAIDLAGNVSITANATLSAPPSSSFTVGGNWSNSGTFTSNSGTVTMDAGDSGNTLGGTMTGSSEFGGVAFNNAAGSWTFNAAASTSGNFTITTATAVTAPSGTLTVDGNFTGGSAFTHNSGNVTLAGSNSQTLAGATSFYDLTATAATSRAVIFPASTTQTIAANGDLSLTGTSCTALLQLKSSSSGSAWTLTRTGAGTGTTAISYAEISDSTATNALSASNSVDAGGNTSWTITGACIGSGTAQTSTGYGFQRKTFYDVTNDRHWIFYHDGDEIEIKYSSDDGSNWTRITSLSYDTNDFSVWNKAIGGTEYVWLAVASGDDILIRRGTLSTTSISWDGTTQTGLDGSGATDSYSYPTITADSSNYLWVMSRYYDGTNYGIKALDSVTTGNSTWASLTWNTATQLSDTQTDANVYGTISPLATQDMYATFAVGTALEGCTWDDSDGAWEDSTGASCAVVGGSSEVFRPAKIDEAGDIGALISGGEQIVRTSTGIYYAAVNDGGSCEVWKSDNGNNWVEQDTANNPSCTSGQDITLAIDGNDLLHMVYDDAGDIIVYQTFGTVDDAFDTPETIATDADLVAASIAIDSNNIPHVATSNNGVLVGSSFLTYHNRVGGSWGTSVGLIAIITGVGKIQSPKININEDNIPEVVAIDTENLDLTAAIGADNNPNIIGEWTIHDIDTTVNNTAGQLGASIGVDSSGNTWVAFVDEDGASDFVKLVKHNDADGWTTWQAAVTNSNVGYEPSLVIDGSEIYLFYENDTDDISYDMYNGTGWLGEKVLHTGTYQDVKVKSSYLNNNFPKQLDYLFSDGEDVYWDYLQLSVKIDDAGDPGAMTSSSRQIVKTSGGIRYAVINDGGSCEIWKSSDGQSWAEQDSTNNPACHSTSHIAVAIDALDILHIIYFDDDAVGLHYITYDTESGGNSDDLFNTEAAIEAVSVGSNTGFDIAIDTNNIAHVVANSHFDNLDTSDIYYWNRVGGSWNIVVVENDSVTGTAFNTTVSITISEDNIPEISYFNKDASDLTAAVGNQNNASSFTLFDVDTSINITANQYGASIAVDNQGNTWIGYIDVTTNYVTLVKHNDADAWSTWQTPITNSNVGSEPSLVTQGGRMYVFYEDDADDVVYDYYDGFSLVGEKKLHIGTFQDVKVRWSSLNWHDPKQVDYLYSDGTDIYWDELDINLIVDDTLGYGTSSAGSRLLSRTSTGGLYVVHRYINGFLILKSTDNGITWVIPDPSNAPSANGPTISTALDSSGVLHILFTEFDGFIDYDVRYVTFNTTTDTYGSAVNIDTSADSGANYITIDSNDKPHVVYEDSGSTLVYTNRVSGSWKSPVSVEAVNVSSGAISINEDDIVEISYINSTDDDLGTAVGNQNDATSFSLFDIDASINDTAAQLGTSIAVDTSGNTWVSVVDSDSTIDLYKHNDADGWTTWQSVVTNGNTGYAPSIAIDGTDIYVFYEDNNDNIVYDMYNGSVWSGEVFVQKGLYQSVHVRWSYLNNESYMTYGIDYIYSNGVDAVYDNVSLSGGGGVGNQDAIDTIPTGITKTLSAAVDTTNYDVHLTYVDDETTDQISYKRYDLGTVTWDASAVNLDASATNAYPSLSIDSDTGDLYSFYTDTSTGTIYYCFCDVSAAGASACSEAADWAAETSWKTGSQVYTSSSYSEPSEVFAVWGDGSSGVGIEWDRISFGAASSTFTQNDFEWFAQQDSVTLTNNWPTGSGADLSENEALTQIPASNEPLKKGDQIRIQMNVTVATATLSSSSQAFKLQYDAAEDCTAASGWTDVGAKASGSIWRFYDETSLGDSATEVNQISTSDVTGGYSEANPSATNPSSVTAGQDMEWDWAVENNGATNNTSYCFRMVESDGTVFNAYNADSYPKLLTAPGTADLLRHGNIFQNSQEKGFFWAN